MNSTAEIDKKLEQLTSKIKKITEFVEKVFEKGPEKDRNELIHDELTRKEYLLKDKEYLLTKKEYLLKEKELQATKTNKPLSDGAAIKHFNEICGVKLTDQEEVTLFLKFSNYLPLLQRKRLAANDARKLLLQIKTTLKTMTIAKVVKNQGFLFEKIIGTGNGNSLVYRVLQLSTGAVLCGKVYGDLVFNNLNAHAEVKTIAQLHGDDPHPNTAKIYETIEFSHESTPSEPGLVALIFPYYPMSLSDIMQAFGQTIFPYNLFLSLARGLLSAGTRFQEKNFAHCDLKPQNVMMDNFVPVVIDFGAVTELGFPLREHTPFYSLDANEEKVSPHYDLFCIVVILARCFLPSLDLEERSRVGFMGEINDYVSRDKELEKYGKLCIDLLNCQSSKEGLTCLP